MRYAFSWSKFLALIVFAAALVPAAASAATPEEVETAKQSAAEWIRGLQDPSTGAIPGFGGDWAATGLAAAGVDSAAVRVAPGDPSLQDHLLDEYTTGTWLEPPGSGEFPAPVTEYERATLVSHAAGLDPARLSADQNMPAQIAALWNPSTGSFGTPSSNGTAFALLALAEATPIPHWALQPTIAYLRRNQHDDGGWEFGAATTPQAREGKSTVDMTGAAIAAFCESGVPPYDPQVAEGVEFLHNAFEENATESGGFEYPYGGPNADTTAWGINGLNACGVNPQGPEWTTEVSRKTPVDFLLSLQATTGDAKGSFEYFGSPDLYSSQDALRAISGLAFTANPPSVRQPPSVEAGAPVPHLLVIDLGSGDVRYCKVTAPADAPLTSLLEAAQASSSPGGCVTSLTITDGTVDSIDGVTPADEGDAWLVRLDEAQVQVAAQQSVRFGDLIALRSGASGGVVSQSAGPAGHPGPAGNAGPQGKTGKQGRRGPRGRSGRNGKSCRAAHRGSARKARCRAKRHHLRL